MCFSPTVSITNLFIDNMEKVRSLSQTRRLLITTIALSSLCTQLTIIMALAPEARATWDEVETTAFVDYLWEHRAESGEGGNFKDVTFNGAAQSLAQQRTAGPSKKAKQCKTKWQSVCFLLC